VTEHPATARRRVRTNDLGNAAYTSLHGLCELLLVRHGEQDIGEESTLGEALDAPLSALGRAQAQAVGARTHEAWPHVEDVPAFRRRSVSAIDAIIEREVGRRVVVACHGGVINAYLRRVLDSEYDHLVGVHHTSITVIRGADDRRALLQVNDHDHALQAAGVVPFTSR